jgi:hypothetical protein
MKTSTYIAMLLALVVTQNASAIRVAGEQDQTAAAPSSQAASFEREGAIGKIDLNDRIMVVNGVRYSFSIAALTVHGTSLLALKKNDRIRFKALNESGKERIIEIWLIPMAQH